ncbi:MAG: PAS domain-containing protein [Parvibaculum sp.]|uniref:PAS domain-containing protein n=1 Tax=Parvibaculum sp. TaxID=2024848 RepID=UPI00284B964C|nr:PAS domain-containing protein [Parvibaculum sp.]MDR3498038.1 PAS domain-containing protein [Parvibaculum sp.]
MSKTIERPAPADAQIHYLDAPAQPDVAALAAYWERKRGTRRMPDRQDIVPAEIVRLLPYLHISEVLDGGGDFRFRIFGTALVNLIGAELTGKRLSELGQPSALIVDAVAAKGRWSELTTRAYKSARPVYATGYFVNTVHRHVQWHAFSAPLTAAGDEIAQMLGGIFFSDQH